MKYHERLRLTLAKCFLNFLGQGPLYANHFFHRPQSYVTLIFCPTNSERQCKPKNKLQKSVKKINRYKQAYYISEGASQDAR